MNTIIIFDLDDTLVNCKMKIPRQTYHMLNKFKKLNYLIGIITYNWMVRLVANETNLYKYTSHIFYEDIEKNIRK
jgi:hydroxymethylpyrimidine pyrophosphatase-like HAD family hydrolase